ncbi:unnamed protein product [Rangifer tarandus platyrhynchus]|uniref:Uncharacterized protein n=1 Tax=Rangifer tarandus platyrhynchus TaxID=3082113 RepID=A0ABN8Z596_RANTA|nr:unnamed protein product [Rangifer tarandus platyrhynchus]
MRPGARLSAGPLLPPPGPGRAKFLSRSRRRLTGRLAADESEAAETRAGAGTCYPGRETKKKEKPSEDQRGATGLASRRESAEGAGSRSRGRPAPRLPEGKGAPAPLARRDAEDSRGGAWAPPARPLRGVPAPPAPRRSSRRGGGRTAKEGTRLPGPGGHPASSPRGHGAGTCRRGGSPALSLCLSRAPPAPQPAQQAARAPDAAAGDWQRPRSGPSPPGQRPAQSRPRGPQDPPPIGPWGCQSAPKSRAGYRSSRTDWRPNAVHANKAPPPAICTSASV